MDRVVYAVFVMIKLQAAPHPWPSTQQQQYKIINKL